MDRILIIVIFIIIFESFGITVKAGSMAENNIMPAFEMNEISISKIPSDFKESLDVSYSEITDKTIKLFDVDTKGNIIICFEDGSANIYNYNLEYCYSISYFSHQSSSVFFDNDAIAILLDRSDILVCLDENNEISKTYEIINSFDNSKAYQNIKNRQTINYDNYSYVLDKNLLKCQLIRVESNGRRESVYSANSKFVNALKILVIILGFILALMMMLLIIEWKNVFSVIKRMHLT